jgi:hypothetical protein
MKERKSEILAAAELWSLLKSGQLKTGQTLTWPSSSAVSSSRVATMCARRGFGPRFFFLLLFSITAGAMVGGLCKMRTLILSFFLSF